MTRFWRVQVAMSSGTGIQYLTKRAGSNGITNLTRLRLPFRIGLIEVYTSCSGVFHSLPNMVRTARLLFVTPHSNVHSEGRRTRTILRFYSRMNQRVFEYLWLDTNLRKALETISWLFTINRKSPGVAKCASGSSSTLAVT